MPKYKVQGSRSGERSSIYGSFEAGDDGAALTEFKKSYEDNPSYEWDWMRLHRIGTRMQEVEFNEATLANMREPNPDDD